MSIYEPHVIGYVAPKGVLGQDWYVLDDNVVINDNVLFDDTGTSFCLLAAPVGKVQFILNNKAKSLTPMQKSMDE